MAYAAAPLARVVPRRRPVVVVCGPRTGSELLLRTLASAYGIHYDGEVTTAPLMHPVPFLNGRAVRHRLGYACKIIDQQLLEGMHFLQAERVLRGLADAGFLVVKLVREDRFAQVVSSVRSWNGSQSHRGPDDPESPTARIDPDELISFLWRRDALAGWLDDALTTVPHMVVRYESDLLEPDRRAAVVRAIGQACDWGPAVVPEQPPLARTSSGDLAADIVNWPEVVARLAVSRYASLLPAGDGAPPPSAGEPLSVSGGSAVRP